MNRRQKKKQEKQERQAVKDFFDRVLPGSNFTTPTTSAGTATAAFGR